MMMKRIYILLLAIPLILGCIREDVSDCKSKMLLRFSYNLNNQYKNLFDEQVNNVTVFLFDTKGKYVDQYITQGDVLTNDYVMEIPVAKGTYSVLVYGGPLNTYSLGELNSDGSFNHSLGVGTTDINDVRIVLNNQSLEANYLTPLIGVDDLYAGHAFDVPSNIDNGQVTDIDLMKYTKNIKVTIRGADDVALNPKLYITALNGRYKYNDSIDYNHGVFKYLPNGQDGRTIRDLEYNFKKLRMVIGNPTKLVIQDKNTNKEIYNKDVIEEVKSTGKYVTQEDLDREDQYNIDIILQGGVGITVSVNGWVINNISNEQTF